MTVPVLRLNVLRALYLFIATGLALTIWPDILFSSNTMAGVDSVVSALLGALGVLCLLGLKYPLKMLPVLLFEFSWKLIWVMAYALPMALNTGLDDYAKDTLFACLIGLVLVPLAIPWRYAIGAFLKAKPEPWLRV